MPFSDVRTTRPSEAMVYLGWFCTTTDHALAGAGPSRVTLGCSVGDGVPAEVGLGDLADATGVPGGVVIATVVGPTPTSGDDDFPETLRRR